MHRRERAERAEGSKRGSRWLAQGEFSGKPRCQRERRQAEAGLTRRTSWWRRSEAAAPLVHHNLGKQQGPRRSKAMLLWRRPRCDQAKQVRLCSTFITYHHTHVRRVCALCVLCVCCVRVCVRCVCWVRVCVCVCVQMLWYDRLGTNPYYVLTPPLFS